MNMLSERSRRQYPPCSLGKLNVSRPLASEQARDPLHAFRGVTCRATFSGGSGLIHREQTGDGNIGTPPAREELEERPIVMKDRCSEQRNSYDTLLDRLANISSVSVAYGNVSWEGSYDPSCLKGFEVCWGEQGFGTLSCDMVSANITTLTAIDVTPCAHLTAQVTAVGEEVKSSITATGDGYAGTWGEYTADSFS
ncbi:hypothetical protein PR048_019439 [Dryococelus australis]|uniref:Uncharacterized protein n=1 Tax=Dryococelus australis TaxID=614101 RepID=A0ABQ9H3H4_9NEOP|nr:hypothetical protein PR048_019439 [Dryococelus australis]